jgi:hypothetical protein
LKAGVVFSQQGALYIFLEAHLTNPSSSPSHTFSLSLCSADGRPKLCQ